LDVFLINSKSIPFAFWASAFPELFWYAAENTPDYRGRLSWGVVLPMPGYMLDVAAFWITALIIQSHSF